MYRSVVLFSDGMVTNRRMQLAWGKYSTRGGGMSIKGMAIGHRISHVCMPFLSMEKGDCVAAVLLALPEGIVGTERGAVFFLQKGEGR